MLGGQGDPALESRPLRPTFQLCNSGENYLTSLYVRSFCKTGLMIPASRLVRWAGILSPSQLGSVPPQILKRVASGALLIA